MKKRRKHCAKTFGTSLWNNPDVKVRQNEQLYCTLLNCMVESFFGKGLQKLVCLADLNTFLGPFERLATWSRDHEEIETYFAAQQVVCFLKKLELPLFEAASRDVAMEKWRIAEAECKEMNERCWDIFRHPLTHSHSELSGAILLVRKEIRSLLGDVPPDLPEVSRFLRFGPGSSLTHLHREGGAIHKLQKHSALVGMDSEVQWLVENTGLFAEVLLTDDPSTDSSFQSMAGCEPSVEYFDYARLDFVPKSTVEKRTIEIGPSLATLFQQAYDGFIRTRLKDEWNLDLRAQAPNQSLAYLGSVLGDSPNSPCTIDLSSASDRISYGLVAMLLPPSWVRTLSTYRAKKVQYGGDFITLEKFASMGNALTFSLQTLIFSAVVRSVLRERGWEGSKWRVYGDDIIVPRRVYGHVVARLQLFGFKINESKSFSQGHFRESCGVDYFRGTNVRPMYVKKPLTTVAELYKVLNLIQLTAMRAPISARLYKPLYRMVLGLIPRQLWLLGETRCALDSCIWSPSVVGGRILTRRIGSRACSEKLAYLTSLFIGYAKADGDMMSPIQPHALPRYQTGESFVIRRAPEWGRAALHVRPADLPFDPLTEWTGTDL